MSSVVNTESAPCHPFVVGELACGALNRRNEILRLLRNLTQAPVVQHDDVLAGSHDGAYRATN